MAVRSNKADKRPSFPFYVKDVASDPNLRMVSPGAVGLWFWMLVHMWMAHRRGCLVYRDADHKEHPHDPKTFARVIGWDSAEVARYWVELVSCGVCSREEGGAVYSRRMVDEAAAETQKADKKAGVSEARRKAGQKSAEARAAKKSQQNGKQTTSNGSTNDVANIATLRQQNPNKSNQELAAMLSKVEANTALPKRINGHA